MHVLDCARAHTQTLSDFESKFKLPRGFYDVSIVSA